MTDKQRVVCQNCNGVVGVPAGRLADGPRCPKCHTPLFDGHPVELGAERRVEPGMAMAVHVAPQ